MRSILSGLLLIGLLGGSQIAAAADLRVATFSVDITPPLGRPVGLGFIPILTTAEHPLLARGVLLDDGDTRCVICTLDLMEVHNETYDFLRKTIGAAAKVPPSQVALQALHQHTAPAIDSAALGWQLPPSDPRRIASAEYVLDMSQKLTAAIERARQRLEPVSRIGIGKAKVTHVASNRRIPRPDGSIQGRSSHTRSAPQLRELEEGLIDPWVRTVSFESSQRPIVQLHYYASHPQSFYGDGRASYDVPGIVREQIERATGVFQVYLTGCGGDVAFGKYNDGSREARGQLVDRLKSGIEMCLNNLTYSAPKPLRWRVRRMPFPLRTDKPFTAAENRRILLDPDSSTAQTRKAAIALAWIERVESHQAIELSCLSIGRIRMLHLPGEPFVQFQLAAQKMRPNEFVCVAGYGDCGMGYIGGDRIYTDKGGYEQTYAFAGPCEQQLLETIKQLLSE